MQDLNLSWSGDLSVAPSGDILTVDDSALSAQRVLRRLLTAPTDYIWQPTYGGGLGQFVGQANVAAAAAGVILRQMLQESSVVQQPAPQVSAEPLVNGSVVVSIDYTVAVSGLPQSLNFSMSA